jgi:hypothetical protein
MNHSNFILRRSDIDEIKYCVNWRMCEINSIAGKILHIFLVYPIHQAVFWYYIISFPGSINAEDYHLFVFYLRCSLSPCNEIVLSLLRICNRIINDSLQVCDNIWHIIDMCCLLPFVWSKCNIPDTLGVASVPAIRWLVVMTDFLLFSIRQKGQWLNIMYGERIRGIKTIVKKRHWQHILKPLWSNGIYSGCN